VPRRPRRSRLGGSRGVPVLVPVRASPVPSVKKERKQTTQGRDQGWEDGTPLPHRDFKERSVVLAVAHPNPWSSASFYLPSQSLADSRCDLHATSRSSHSRRSPSCRFLLCRVALVCLVRDAAAACRSLAIPASPAFRRNSALLAAYFGPSSLSSSPRARTTLLTPTAIICRQVISLLRSTLSSNTCASTDDVGAGVPFGCIVTADDGITPLVFRPPRSLLPRLPPVRLYVQRGSPFMP